ncbi:MAG: hypothetical protein AAGB04_03215 [Pseudomonadota bacterium]
MINRFAIFILLPTLTFSSAIAQENYSAGSMWGTDGSGVAVNGGLQSAATHTQNGLLAGQVEAAKAGVLIANGEGGNITIQSIGSQSVISTSINGDDNDVTVNNPTQTTENSGDVTNEGQVGDNTSNVN